MKKLYVYSILFGALLLTLSVSYADDLETKTGKRAEEIYSTEGYEIEENIQELTQETKYEKQHYKKDIQNKKKYHKNISKLKKMKEKQRINERNLEYINQRLEIKKNKLEEITSDNL